MNPAVRLAALSFEARIKEIPKWVWDKCENAAMGGQYEARFTAEEWDKVYHHESVFYQIGMTTYDEKDSRILSWFPGRNFTERAHMVNAILSSTSYDSNTSDTALAIGTAEAVSGYLFGDSYDEGSDE